MKYVNKPVIIDAIKYNSDIETLKEVIDLLGFIPEIKEGKETDQMFVKIKFATRELLLSKGEYLIKDELGIFKVLNARDFELKYDMIKGEI